MKFDLHMHSRFSPDSESCPKDIVQRALQLGYGLIAITDHDVNAEAFDWLVGEGVISTGGLLTRIWAQRLGFPAATLRVLPGQEISTASGHLLCVGARLASCWGIPAVEAVAEIHRQGGWAIAAHPYDRWRVAYEREELETLPFDAIEIFNGGATNAQVNQRAGELAQRRRLPGVANSDGHTVAEIGRGCSEVEAVFTESLAVILGSTIRTHTKKIEPRVVIGDAR